jgi:hypothetical protein
VNANYPGIPDRPGCKTATIGRSPPRSPRSRTPGTYPPRDDRQIVELFDRNKSDILSQSEAVELDRYLLLEDWVRLAKAHAYKHLQTAA